jgi:hypothetical protein
MPHCRYLTQDRFDALYDALVDAGLAQGRKLDALEEGLDPAFRASLPESPEGNVRLLQTLGLLDVTERLADGSIPFVTWLGNAIKLTGGGPSAGVVKRALVDVKARAAGVASAPDPTSPASGTGAAGGQEVIVQSNDLLPYGFLAGGALAGRSVARVQVERCDGGVPALLPSGAPTRFLGTGWLIAPGLLVTNHHVVNARNEGEPRASAADLEHQARGLVAHFDLDSAAAEPVEERVQALEAYSACDGPLDYAILRLARVPGRTPLTLAAEPFSIQPDLPDARPPLNILEHPEGGPKMVACRNNLAMRVTDTEVWYFTDTMSGSSGAPVLDDRWRVVALHKRWGFAENVTFQGKATAWVNIGTLMVAILRDLEATGKTALLAEIRAASA